MEFKLFFVLKEFLLKEELMSQYCVAFLIYRFEVF